MNEVKRGAPPQIEGQWWAILSSISSGEYLVEWRPNIQAFFTAGGGEHKPENILCHRPHIPLEVPELKKLHRCAAKAVVVRFPDGPPIFAEQCIAADGRHMLLIHSPMSLWPGVIVQECNDVELLTRAECEAAGYEFPADCEEPK